MAEVIFHPDQPVQALSGSYGEATFRTLPDGRTVVHCHQPDDDEQLRRWILQAWYNTRRKLPSRGKGQQLATIFDNGE